MGLQVVILAAGQGKRMTSSIPKVLHTIGGKPMLAHVIEMAQSLHPEHIHVIYGDGGPQVCEALSPYSVNWVQQAEQKGTGHAVMQVLPNLALDDQVLILYGDVPLTPARLIQELIRDTPEQGLGLIVTELDDPTGFGRIVRNELGNIVEIVEHKDAAAWQQAICEINTGIMLVSAQHLQSWLPHLSCNNAQQEYYLTDIVACAVSEGVSVGGVIAYHPEEVLGVNDRWQQVELERYFQLKQAKRLALLGVQIADAARIDIRGEVSIGTDSFVDVNVVMEGNVSIGERCHIGPNVYLKSVEMGDDVVVGANSVIEGATVAEGAQVGPFARLRAGAVIERKARVGNFVEVKKTTLGEGSKASHLAYLGDAVIGRGVNIGAGTITCNYDGASKHTTHIADGAFVGSNTALVAPVVINESATIAAGSTITRDVASDALAITRPEQKMISGWRRPIKNTDTAEN